MAVEDALAAMAVQPAHTMVTFVVRSAGGEKVLHRLRALGARELLTFSPGRLEAEEEAESQVIVLSLGTRSVRAPPQHCLSDAEILERLDARDIGAATVSAEDKWQERNDPIAVLRHAWVAEGFSEEVCKGTFPLREDG
jgi:hypothetical protein